MPGDSPGNFYSALNLLGDRATYFYSGSGKYWYDLQANITRRAKDQAASLHKEEVWEEIRKRLEGQAKTRGDFAAVHVCPEENGDIPDTDEARLVILHPRVSHRKGADSTARAFAHRATEHRGTSNRTYRNMIVFLAADEARLEELDNAVRDYLGWSHVLDNADDLDLTQSQKNQATDRRRSADETVTARLLGTYQWALTPDQPDPSAPFVIGATKVEGQAAGLAERVSKKLGSDGHLSIQQAAQTIRMRLDEVPAIWSAGHVSLGSLWQVYATYPYMPRLRDRGVLAEGLAAQPLIWQQDGFALAASYDTTQERYAGLWIPGDNGSAPAAVDSVLLVQPRVASDQRRREVPEPGVADTDVPEPDPTATTPPAAPTPPVTPSKTRFFASTTLTDGHEAADFRQLFDEILPHLRSGRLIVRIEIDASSADGFDERVVRTVSENATTLKVEQHGFEE